MSVVINTAVWGYHNEWHDIKAIIERHINSSGNLEINVFKDTLSDYPALRGVVKELRISYSIDKKNYQLLIQEDPRPKKGKVLHIDYATKTVSVKNAKGKELPNGWYLVDL